MPLADTVLLHLASSVHLLVHVFCNNVCSFCQTVNETVLVNCAYWTLLRFSDYIWLYCVYQTLEGCNRATMWSCAYMPL